MTPWAGTRYILTWFDLAHRHQHVIARTLQPSHPQREMAREAVKAMTARGEELQLVPQNLVELWVVATRPAEQNGLGFTIAEAASELRHLRRIFRLLPETPEIYPAWEGLVLQYQVAGKPAHDARLVAAMRVHGIASILTFDKSGFSRYAGIQVVHLAEVAGR